MGSTRLQQVSDPTTWAQYTYDNRSRVTQTLYSNGVKSVYGYDSSGRTTALTHRNASNAIIIGYRCLHSRTVEATTTSPHQWTHALKKLG